MTTTGTVPAAGAAAGGPPVASTAAGRRAPVVLMAAMAAGSMALFPLLPTLQADHGLSTASIGLLGAAGFVAAVVGELLLGPRVDDGHTRPLVLGSVVLMAVALAAHAAATDLWQFLALRALVGLAFGAFVPAVSAEAVRAAPARAGRELGRLQSAELVGLAVGPLVAALAVARIGAGPTLLALGVSVAATVPLALRVAGPPAAARSHPSHAHAPAGPAGVDRPGRGARARGPVLPLDLLRAPGVAGAVLLTVAFMVPIGAYDSLWPRYLADLGASPVLVGVSYTVFAIPFAVLATRAGARADRVGGLRTAWAGMAVMLPCLVAYGFLRDPLVATGLGFVESGGQAFVSVAAAAAVAHAVPRHRAGAGQGLARSLGTMAAAVVAAVAGPVYSHAGAAALFVGTAAVTVAAMAVATRCSPARPGASVPEGRGTGHLLPVGDGQG